jgi:hypothetical protein
MFKPGEVARVRYGGQFRRHFEGKDVTVEEVLPTTIDGVWNIKTNEGIYKEDELFPAHPTVLTTAEAKESSWDRPSSNIEDIMAAERARLSSELRDGIEEALKKATLDFNGHWKNGTILRKEFKKLEHVFVTRHSMSEEDAVALVRAAKSGTPLDRWIDLAGMLGFSDLRTCNYCGEHVSKMETNGIVVRYGGPSCEYPDGLPLTEWELNVPSGKLAVANDLRRLFPLPDGDDFDVNTILGCRQTALAYAANGMSHASVGNTCPGVYQCGDGLFKIATEPYEDVKPRPKFEGKRVAGICTDLWWYSICDYAEFERRCKRFKQKAKDFRVETVTVKPGVYRFRHDEEARRLDGPGECVFARFEWVREPDAVKDFLAKYEEVEVNPHAYVHAQVTRWPTLYGKTVNPQAWQRVADQVFCTIGSGVEWHEKGFPKAKVDPSIADVEPPSFRAQHHWYPFSKPYGGLFEPKTLTPGFAKLAFRVLESVISFGMNVRDGEHSREVRYVRDRMLLAVQRYRELAKQYPEQADPEYVAWLSQKGRAEAWIENFPLGPEFTEKHRKNAER